MESSCYLNSTRLIPVSTNYLFSKSKLIALFLCLCGSYVGRRYLEFFLSCMILLDPWICILMPFSMSMELVFKYIWWELVVWPRGLLWVLETLVSNLVLPITRPLPIKESLWLLEMELIPVWPRLISVRSVLCWYSCWFLFGWRRCWVCRSCALACNLLMWLVVVYGIASLPLGHF